MTRTLITGAGGFIGRHAVAAASSDGPVCAVVRERHGIAPGEGVVPWDGTGARLVEIFSDFAPDRVLHLAAAYRRRHDVGDISTLVTANVETTALVLEAAARSSQPVVVLAGSWFQHFGRHRRALNLYAATKLAAAEIARYYGDAEGVRSAWVTLYDVYGPGQRRGTLVTRALEASGGGAPLAIPADDPVVGLIFVDDAVAALQAAAAAVEEGTAQPGAEMFALPHSFVPVSAVVAAVEEVTGRSVAIADAPYPAPDRSIREPVTGDPPPGWSAQVTLAEGLRRMLTDS